MALHRMESMDAARFGDAIAVLTAGFFKANGAKNADAIELNPHRKALMVAEAKYAIPPVAARVVLELIGEGKVPAWAMDRLEPEMQTIKLAALEL